MNIVNLLAGAARTFPERPGLSIGTRTVSTYGQFAQRVSRLAGALRERCGNAPGARVAIVAGNSPEYIEVMWAGWHAGLCVVPVNAKLHPKEVAFILENCAPSLCFVSEDLAANNYPNAIVLGSREYAKLAQHALVAAHAVAPGDPAWLFYTSGTTGRQKGATVRHRNLLEMSLRNYADINAVGADDCILHVAPLSHATGLFALFHVGKASNQVIPESRGFREDELVELIGHYSKCLLFLAPTMLNRLVAHPASAQLRKENLKTLIYGGAPMYLADPKPPPERPRPCLRHGHRPRRAPA